MTMKIRTGTEERLRNGSLAGIHGSLGTHEIQGLMSLFHLSFDSCKVIHRREGNLAKKKNSKGKLGEGTITFARQCGEVPVLPRDRLAGGKRPGTAMVTDVNYRHIHKATFAIKSLPGFFVCFHCHCPIVYTFAKQNHVSDGFSH